VVHSSLNDFIYIQPKQSKSTKEERMGWIIEPDFWLERHYLQKACASVFYPMKIHNYLIIRMDFWTLGEIQYFFSQLFNKKKKAKVNSESKSS
jgi:hypothetical protein